MRPTDMSNLRAALTAVAATALLAGCASASSSSPAAAGASSQSGVPSGSASSAGTSPPGSATPDTSAAPSASAAASASATLSATAPVTTSGPAAPSAPPTVAGAWVPASAKSALLAYTGAVGAEPITAHKTVTGATYERLSSDLNVLTLMPAGSVQCNIATVESATITVSGSGRTLVFVVPGAACRGVRLTINGAAEPPLIGSVMLLSQIRAIVGYTGKSHPLTGSTVSR